MRIDGYEEVFAVYRIEFDLFRMRAEDILDDPRQFVTVEEVVWTLEEAEAEVERLDALHADQNCLYGVAITRVQRRGDIT